LVREEIAGDGAASVVASVLTAGGKAAILQGRQQIDDPAMVQLARKVATSGLPAASVKTFGTELAKMILPPEIHEVLLQETQGDDNGFARPLVIVHDAPMSRVPWETLHLGDVAPALLGGLTHRYDGGVMSVAKWRDERAKTIEFNILLVINPTLDLPGADKEGERVEQLLAHTPGVRITKLHSDEAPRSDLLRCFQSGKFDMVHYAGHAFFDPEHRARSGILCSGREVLSGADLASLSQLPSLVFFNACEIARVRRAGGPEEATKEPTQGAIGFAESFLAGGVANYLGTYWPVNDEGAEAFAGAFYAALLQGDSLSVSLIKGRKAVLAKELGDWANYVLYGNPDFKLLSV
jgi:CHAT domain-containing protein